MTRTLFRTALAVAAAALVGATGAAQAATVTYVFDYPAIGGLPGVQHPAVATLTLTDIAGGVQFLLTPDWEVVGHDAQWDEMQLTYQGPALSGLTFTDLGPAVINIGKLEVKTSTHAGYAPDAGFLGIHWDNTGQVHHFDYSHLTSAWSLTGAGVTLDSFAGSLAWADNKVSPIRGVLSGQGIAGDTSNWVTATSDMPGPIPEPSTYAMLLAGLGVMGLVARRRRPV